MAKSIHRRYLLTAVLAPAALVVLAGCAAAGGKVSAHGDKEALRKRAQEYWALIRANDRVKAWSYEALSKDPNGSLEGYLKRGGITFDEVEVREVRSFENDRAVVDVFIRYALPLLRVKKIETITQDDWRLIDGVWHHVLRPSAMFPEAHS